MLFFVSLEVHNLTVNPRVPHYQTTEALIRAHYEHHYSDLKNSNESSCHSATKIPLTHPAVTHEGLFIKKPYCELNFVFSKMRFYARPGPPGGILSPPVTPAFERLSTTDKLFDNCTNSIYLDWNMRNRVKGFTIKTRD